MHQTGCSGSFSLGHCQRPEAYLLLCTAIIQVFVFPPGVSKRLVLHRPHALLLVLIEDRSCHPVFSRLSGHPVRTNLTHVIPLCGPLKRETDRHRGNSKQVPMEKEMFQNLTVSFLGKEGREGKERRRRRGEPSKTSKESELIVSVGLLPCDESRRLEGGRVCVCAWREREMKRISRLQ